MSAFHVKYLILGGGSAAASCAESLRQIDPSGDVLLVSAQTSRPYHRPPLARGYLRKELRPVDLFTHPADWYSRARVTLRTNVRALQLDPPRKSVTLSDGQRVLFDRLLIATGATPRPLTVPGAQLPGVMSFRTFEDVDRIQHAADIALSVGHGRVAVIGSGLIATEIAASLALRRSSRKLAVTLICPAAHVLDPLAGENASRAVERALEALGVTVRTRAPLAGLAGDGRVQRVELAGEAPLPVDFAVVATGWAPQIDVIRNTAISAEKAILVDARGQTNVEGIFAVGECAAMFDPVFGKHRLLDHWDAHRQMAQVVGINIAGGSAAWEGITIHSAEVGTPEAGLTKVRILGEPRFADRRIVRDAGDQGLAEIALDRAGRPCSAALVSWTAEITPIISLLRSRTPLTGREDQIRDPNQPL